MNASRVRQSPEVAAEQRGVTLVELAVGLAVSAVIALSVISVCLPLMRSERAKGAVYQIHTFLQRARTEAVSRGRDCRFVLDAEARTISVVDLNDEANNFDDVVLRTANLDQNAEFVDPEGGAPITLRLLSAKIYETTYSPAGVVKSGAGEVFIAGGGRHRKITVFVGGGLRVQRRQDGDWIVGS